MKKIKVFQNGVYLRDISPYATKWQVIKFKVAQWIGRVVREVVRWMKLGLAVSVACILGAFVYGNYVGVSTHFVFAENTDTLSIKVEQMKKEVVNQISNMENKTNIPIVIDDNKAGTLPKKDKVSIGCMQFKISTVQHYENVLYKVTMNDNEAVVLALDCEKAKELAQEIIFNTVGGLWNWSVATKEIGTKVEVIKELEK